MVNIINIDAMLKSNLLNNKPYHMLVNPKALSTQGDSRLGSNNLKDNAYNGRSAGNQVIGFYNSRNLRDYT